MSNYLSQPINYKETKSNVDLKMLNTVLAVKQGKYDANKAKIQQVLDSYGSVELLRDSDSEYLANRLRDVTQTVNNSGQYDLSNSSISDSIFNQVKQVANDEIVVNALENTAIFKNFQQSVAKIKEKNKESYSDQNYNFAIQTSSYQDYMEGKTGKITGLNYTPYNNYQKEIQDTIFKLESTKKGHKVQVPQLDENGQRTGQLIETEINGLNPQEIEKIARSMITPAAAKQIEIDGWVNSGGWKNPQAIQNTLQAVTEPLKQDIINYESEISKVDAELNSGKALSSERITKLNNTKQYFKNSVESLKSNLEEFTTNPRAASTYLESNKVINGIKDRFAPLYSESVKYEADDFYFKTENLRLKQMDYQRKLDKDKAESGVGTNGEIKGVLQIDAGIEPENLVDNLTAIDDEIADYYNGANSIAQDVKTLFEEKGYDSEYSKTVEGFMNEYQLHLSKKPKNIGEVEYFKEFLIAKSQTNPNLKAAMGGSFKSIQDLTNKAFAKNQALQEAEKIKENQIKINLNKPKYFEEIYDNQGIKMIRNGQTVSVFDQMLKEGLIDKDGNKLRDIDSSKEFYQDLTDSYEVNKALNEMGTEIDWSLVLNPVSPVSGISNNYEELYNSNSFRKLARRLGEKKAGELVAKAYKDGFQNTPIRDIYDTLRGDDTGAGVGKDKRLVGDDNYITNAYFGQGVETREYKDKVAKLRKSLASSQKLAVSEKTNKSLYNKMSLALETKMEALDRPMPNIKDKSLSISKSGANEFSIGWQEWSTSRSTGSQSVMNNKVNITKEELRNNFPDLYNSIDMKEEEEFYTYQNFKNKPISSPEISFYKEASQSSVGYAADMIESLPYLDEGRKNMYKNLLIADTAKKVIKNSSPMLVNSNAEYSNQIDFFVENPQLFEVQLKLNQRNEAFFNLVDKTTKEVVAQQKQQGVSSLDDYYALLQETPQIFYGTLLSQTFSQKQDYELGNKMVSTTNYDNLVKYYGGRK